VSIEFPLISKRTSFGIIPDSLIPVQVQTRFGYQTLQFILDTGADFTMLPHHMADIIGIDLKRCPQSVSYGIEGGGIKIFMGHIQIKISHVELKIRCLFSERETTPYLLGRADLFSVFNIAFDNKRRKIRFSKIQ
jgi:hypothetical protein